MVNSLNFSIDMATIEKLNRQIIEKVDPKYAGIVDPKGIDNLKAEVAKNPELKKFFNVNDSEKE